MSNPTAYLCGGRMEVRLRPVASVQDGEPVFTLEPYRALWDGQPVSDVVAEAIAVAWYEAEGEDDEDDD
ncbi:hypothetical protein B0E38_06481 [Streptomyces sp. 111WW2]|uniref:hypothetical protein n=1 Tax=Streptomyces sp. 111WW2 TaxID=1945515 RepID=UPI000D28DA90|nr:hypothetical protein [Streptomyces sp. 111WW2]PSK48004.1 hypothetical protein B0E38_06481 [Streptomyces sp. 111WW2]